MVELNSMEMGVVREGLLLLEKTPMDSANREAVASACKKMQETGKVMFRMKAWIPAKQIFVLYPTKEGAEKEKKQLETMHPENIYTIEPVYTVEPVIIRP